MLSCKKLRIIIRECKGNYIFIIHKLFLYDHKINTFIYKILTDYNYICFSILDGKTIFITF